MNESKLWLAAGEGNADEVKGLLSKGGWTDVNCVRGYNNSTPLWEAAYEGQAEVVQLLLDRGAQPNKGPSINIVTPNISHFKPPPLLSLTYS